MRSRRVAFLGIGPRRAREALAGTLAPGCSKDVFCEGFDGCKVLLRAVAGIGEHRRRQILDSRDSEVLEVTDLRHRLLDWRAAQRESR
jgi:hypothetical protein